MIDRELGTEGLSVVNKVTWQKAGRVTEPGRYMFRYGWVTVTAEDLEVWQKFPEAAFTLISLSRRGIHRARRHDARGQHARIRIAFLGHGRRPRAIDASRLRCLDGKS